MFRSKLDNSKTVAVKTIQKSNYSGSNFQNLAALLSELKIMIYIGKHPNIVQLIGAQTTELHKNGVVFVIVEYCPFGSLYEFLKKKRKILEASKSDKFSVNLPGYIPTYNEPKACSIKKLLKFSNDVCMGMEYLAACKVHMIFYVNLI